MAAVRAAHRKCRNWCDRSLATLEGEAYVRLGDLACLGASATIPVMGVTCLCDQHAGEGSPRLPLPYTESRQNGKSICHRCAICACVCGLCVCVCAHALGCFCQPNLGLEDYDRGDERTCLSAGQRVQRRWRRCPKHNPIVKPCSVDCPRLNPVVLVGCIRITWTELTSGLASGARDIVSDTGHAPSGTAASRPLCLSSTRSARPAQPANLALTSVLVLHLRSCAGGRVAQKYCKGGPQSCMRRAAVPTGIQNRGEYPDGLHTCNSGLLCSLGQLPTRNTGWPPLLTARLRAR